MRGINNGRENKCRENNNIEENRFSSTELN